MDQVKLAGLLDNLLEAAVAASQMIDRSPDKDTANAFVLRIRIRETKEAINCTCDEGKCRTHNRG